MKNDQKKPAQAHETNAWVDNLTGSEGFSGSMLLFGYAGKSASDPENSICLYLDASLNQKLDIRNEDILYSRKTGNGNELEGTLLWVKKDSQSAGKDSTDASSFLQGDLYNAYLSKQAAFPTVPVVSCVVTCTGIPVVCSQAQNAAAQTAVGTLPPPSIVHCTTLLPACQQQQANVAAGFPTVPVVSCVVTCTGIPVVCSQAQNAAAQTAVGTLPPPTIVKTCFTLLPGCQVPNDTANVAAGFPTVPVVSCVVTCTGIPVVCSQAQDATAQAAVATLPPPTIVKTCFTLLPGCQVPNDTANVTAGFPTVPVVSCVVTCTGIPVVCLQAQNAAVQTGVATLPPPSLTHLCPTQVPACPPHTLHQQCTSLIPACTAAQYNTEAGFPTVPVVSCVVTCTGIPVVCSQAQDATANAVALQARLGGQHTAIPPTAIRLCPTLIPRECFPPIDFRTLVPVTCGQPVITIIPTIPRISCAAQCTLISGVCQI